MLWLWYLIAPAALLIGVASILMTYYKPFVTDIWIRRYRMYENTDHVGSILEIIWMAALVAILFLVAVVFFPDQGRLFLSHYGRAWWFQAIVAGLFLLVCFSSFVTSPQEIIDDVKKRYPDEYAKIDSERKERARIRVQYLFYVPWIMVANLAIIISLLLFGIWTVTQYRMILGWGDRFLSASLPPGAGGLVEQTVYQAQSLILIYADFHRVLMSIATHFLGILVLILIVFIWYLGTNFSSLYNIFSLKIYRLVVKTLLFLVLPAILAAFFFQLMKGSDFVDDQFRTALAREGGEMALLSPDRVAEQAALTKTMMEIQKDFDDQYSLSRFWTRLASSWGGVLLLLQALLSYLQKRIWDSSLIYRLFPKESRFIKILELMFRKMPEPPVAQPASGGQEAR